MEKIFSIDDSQMNPGQQAESYIQDGVMPQVMQGLSHILVTQPGNPVAELSKFLKDNNPRRPVSKVGLKSSTVGDLQFHSKESLIDPETLLPISFKKAGEYPVWALELPPSLSELRYVTDQLVDEEKVEHITWVVAGVEDIQCYVAGRPSRATLSSGQWHQANLMATDTLTLSQEVRQSEERRKTGDSGEDQNSESNPPQSMQHTPRLSPRSPRISVSPAPMSEMSGSASPGLDAEPEELRAGYDTPFFRNDKFERLEDLLVRTIGTATVKDTQDTVLHGGILVDGKSHTIAAQATTEVLRNACMDAGFKSVKVVRFQHPSGVPVTMDVYDRMTEMLDCVTEPNSAVVIVSADRWRLVQHLTTMATLYFKMQSDAQRLRRTLNVLDKQLQAEKEVDIDEHNENALYRQRARDESRKYLRRSLVAVLEDKDEVEPDEVIEKRELLAVEREKRRAKQNQRRIEIMQRANTGAATRMQSMFRGHQSRKQNQPRNQRDKIGGRTPQEVDALLQKGRFPLVELCQQTLLDSFGETHFTNGAPKKKHSKSVKVWEVKVSRIPPDDQDQADVSSEDEEWASRVVDKVKIDVDAAANPLFDVDQVMGLLKCEDVGFMYKAFKDHAGVPAIQRRAYAMLERLVHHVFYAGYLSFHHKKKAQEGLLTLKAASIMRVPGSVQGLTHFSEFVKKHSVIKDCLNHPQFSTYFLSNIPAPLNQQRVLVASDASSHGAYLEGTCATNVGGIQEAPQEAVHHRLHHRAPLFWVPDCLTADQWTESAATIIKTVPKCKKVLWISSRPDFTTYVNGTPFFSSGRMESHDHGPDLPSATTIRNTLLIDAALPYTELHNAMDREKFFHPISLIPRPVVTFSKLKRIQSVTMLPGGMRSRSGSNAEVHKPMSRRSSLSVMSAKKERAASFNPSSSTLVAAPGGLRSKSVSVNSSNFPMASEASFAGASKSGRSGSASSDDSSISDGRGLSGLTSAGNTPPTAQLDMSIEETEDGNDKPGLDPVASEAEWFGVGWDDLETEMTEKLKDQVENDNDHTLKYHTLSSASLPPRGPLVAFDGYKVAKLDLLPSQFTKAKLTEASFRVTKIPPPKPETPILGKGALRPLKNGQRGSGSVGDSPVVPNFNAPPGLLSHAIVPHPASLGFSQSIKLGAGGKSTRSPRGPGRMLNTQASFHRGSGQDGTSRSGSEGEPEWDLPLNVSDVFKTPTQTAEDVRVKLKKQHGLDNAMIYRRMPFLDTFGWEWLTNLDALHVLIRLTMGDPTTALAFAMSSPDGVFYGTLCALHWAFEFNKRGVAFTEGRFVQSPLPSSLDESLTPGRGKSPALRKHTRQHGGVHERLESMSEEDASVMGTDAGDASFASRSRHRQSIHRPPRGFAKNGSVGSDVTASDGDGIEKQMSPKNDGAPKKTKELHVRGMHTSLNGSAIDGPESPLAVLKELAATRMPPPPAAVIDPFAAFPILHRMEAETGLDLRAAAKAVSNVMLQCETQDTSLGCIEKHMASAIDPSLSLQERKDAHLQAVCSLERYVLLLLYQCFLQMQATILQLMQHGENASFRDFVFGTHSKVIATLNTLDPWEGREMSPAEAEAMPYPPQAGQLRSSQRWRRNEWMPNIG